MKRTFTVWMPKPWGKQSPLLISEWLSIFAERKKNDAMYERGEDVEKVRVTVESEGRKK